MSFTSTSIDLTGGDGNAAVADVFARDIGTQDHRGARASASDGTTQSLTASEHSAIAGAGSLVAFVTTDAARQQHRPG